MEARVMRKLIIGLLLLPLGIGWADTQKYAGKGMVLKVDTVHRTATVSCQAIPGFMEAMVMPISVRDTKELEGLAPGTSITFTLVVDKDGSYAEVWKADSHTWHFLTGSAAEIRRLCERFGVDVFPDEGLMTHSLHTIVIDRKGAMVSNIEGNQFTADQLGDLVQTVLDSSH